MVSVSRCFDNESGTDFVYCTNESDSKYDVEVCYLVGFRFKFKEFQTNYRFYTIESMEHRG